MEKYKILEKINGTQDLKLLSDSDLEILGDEIRDLILNKVSEVGGHLGPNLGIIELSIALHYVFNSPVDKIIWDVSHQSYTHKILTGRRKAFEKFKISKEISGFTDFTESEHDLFCVGHTSTSVSLASGIAKARDLKGETGNVIAVIGDGSLSGGEAFEGLDNVGTFKSNFIVIVNDNEMSIAKNYGGLYGNLQELRDTNGKAENNFFKTLGFDYKYVEEGNNVLTLIEELKQIKEITKPIVLHVHTKKGKGYKFAEETPEKFHFVAPFDKETGELKDNSNSLTYTGIVANYISEKSKTDNRIIALNAATPGAVGIVPFREENPDKFFDVGIAEEHLIAFASGLASQGMRPIALFMSSFIQRTYDQISQDLCINNNPALIIVENAGISQSDVTHAGMYDISMLSNIPNFTYLAPANSKDLEAMLDWSLNQNFPIGIRIPGGKVSDTKNNLLSNIELNKFEKVTNGEKIAIIGLGNFFVLAENVCEKLKENGVNPTLINPRFITGLDEELLNSLLKDHDTIVTLEDGILDGGFGEKVSRFYANKNVKVHNFGAKKEFLHEESKEELFKRYNLNVEDIINIILK